VEVLGAMNVPAIPMNMGLEKAVLPDGEKLADRLQYLLNS
jgi:2-oxoisovalerate dehydrogenase E1 component